MKPKNKIVSFFSTLFVDFRHFNLITKIEKIVARMNISEKIFFYLISLVFVISGLTLLFNLNNSFLVEIPSFGGSFTEGLVGSPRFINPILAISDTDKDLSSLIYSGLLKNGENGSFEPDLASSYEISNGTIYNIIIKDNAYFHDNKTITADDVIFTIGKILDPVIKSPKKSNWEGVLVEKISDKEIRFTLSKPYVPFLNALTIGILPKHIWENASSEEFPFSEFNINPIGSGPYKVDKIVRNSGGIPTTITLISWNKYTLGRPKIKSISFKFFQNETALLKAYNNQEVDSVAGLSQIAAKHIIDDKNLVMQTALPRVFGVFFNQNLAPVFLNKGVREALDMATPKKRIVDEVLSGFGRVINGPTPSSIETDTKKANGNIEEARSILLNDGWKENESGILEKKTKTGTTLLRFSITTSDTPELKKTAEILKESWGQIGADIEIKIFEAGDLSQNIIKSRKYDALLFGEVVGADSDLYPFWHSSERNDPGLNISLYTNITVDKMLEEIQKEISDGEKNQKKETILVEIKKDIPAIFLFSPYSLYTSAPKVKNILSKDVAFQNERFLFVDKWFIETDKVWKIFAN
ncbi:MAG: ABC transporter substrate-binding protein [Patescibacteria group bacterium]